MLVTTEELFNGNGLGTYDVILVDMEWIFSVFCYVCRCGGKNLTTRD